MPRSTESPAPGPLPVREAWLALRGEPALHSGWPVVDPHHHLWMRPGWPYDAPDLLADIGHGHRVLATVFVQCRSFYLDTGPEELRPIGETAHAAAAAHRALTAGASTRICAGIVGHANLTLGERVRAVLEAHMHAGQGRFRGIRHSTAWDPDPEVANPELGSVPQLLEDARFRAGFAQLASLGLSYDAWVYHPQIDEVSALACAFPDTSIVLNHLGGPIGIGRFADRRDEVFADWCRSITALAACDNVTVKLGGLAMRVSGQDLHLRALPPTSTELAQVLRPYVEAALEAFGPSRCMFESNFPVEKASCDYTVLWNAFKRLCEPLAESERDALLRGTASRVYRLGT